MDIKQILENVYQSAKQLKNEGENAKYIPALAMQDRSLLGIAITDCHGTTYHIGDSDKTVPIESISKVFTLSMLLNHLSIEQVENKIGFKPSFFPFNSVIALALAKNHKVNPFVNNGAIATTAALCHLYPNNSLCWDDIQSFFNEMADDHLECHKHLKSDKSNKNVFNEIVLDESVFESEFNNDQHNYGLANLLDSWGNLDEDVNKAVKTYTKQCSLRVSAEHLSIMASCLANGGKHPITGNQLIKEKNVKHILSLMLSCGLYQESGEWSVYVGVPAKSGVGGGIMMVVPGKFGIGIVSPPLNKAGNSYLGWEIGKMLSKNLGINIFDVKQ